MRMRAFAVVIAGLAAAVGLTSVAVAGGGQTASVTLREFTITGGKLRSAEFGQASVLKPGQTTFTFRNRGQFPHNFVIAARSQGGTKFGINQVGPGQSVTRTVNLKAGAYLAICTVFNGNHYAAGMVRPFTVGTQNTENGSWGP